MIHESKSFLRHVERSTDVTKSVISISKHLLLALHKLMFINIFFFTLL